MEFKVFETFSGIGAQKKALSNLEKKGFNIKHEIIATCDWDINANRSYNRIHHKFVEDSNVDIGKMDNFFNGISISGDGKKPLTTKSQILKKNKEKIYREFLQNKNVCDITNIKDRYKNIDGHENINILTYSFPCQDLSSAGNIHGFNRGVVEGTRSGLLLEIDKLVSNLKENELPKYLLMENVNNLVSQRHYASFENWINKLNELGYSTYWGVINSHDYGSLQKRKRVFALSIKDDKRILSEKLNEKIKDIYDKYKDKFPGEKVEEVIDFSNKYPNESIKALMKDTPSRRKTVRENKKIDEETTSIATVTTKQDRNPNTGYVTTNIIKEGYLRERFITPREAYKLMGFDDIDFEKAKSVSSNTVLYKQAGNSIVVRILELIFLFANELEEK